MTPRPDAISCYTQGVLSLIFLSFVGIFGSGSMYYCCKLLFAVTIFSGRRCFVAIIALLSLFVSVALSRLSSLFVDCWWNGLSRYLFGTLSMTVQNRMLMSNLFDMQFLFIWEKYSVGWELQDGF